MSRDSALGTVQTSWRKANGRERSILTPPELDRGWAVLMTRVLGRGPVVRTSGRVYRGVMATVFRTVHGSGPTWRKANGRERGIPIPTELCGVGQCWRHVFLRSPVIRTEVGVYRSGEQRRLTLHLARFDSKGA